MDLNKLQKGPLFTLSEKQPWRVLGVTHNVFCCYERLMSGTAVKASH